MTGNIAILWPMIAQAALTFGVYVMLFRRRRAAVRAGEAEIAAFRIVGAEPPGSAAAARNLANQFELPVLFYVGVLALFVTNGASWLAVLVAWTFVGLRLAHAVIHLGDNRLRHRIPVFFAGVAAAALLWLLLALHLSGLA